MDFHLGSKGWCSALEGKYGSGCRASQGRQLPARTMQSREARGFHSSLEALGISNWWTLPHPHGIIGCRRKSARHFLCDWTNTRHPAVNCLSMPNCAWKALRQCSVHTPGLGVPGEGRSLR